MKVIVGNGDRGPLVSSAVVLGALGLLSLIVLTGSRPLELAPVIAVTILFAVGYRVLLRWEILLALVVFVILFIPMRRYVLPGSLPFELDPYRLLVAFVLVGWTASLLADPRVRLKRSGLEAPMLLIVFAQIASVLANRAGIASVETSVVKELTFFLSFLVVFFLVVSVVRTHEHIDMLVKVLVSGGAVVALLAIVESRTHYNVFNHLDSVIPLLELQELPFHSKYDPRGLRSFASAQHPIALGAALVLLVPLSVYLVQRFRSRRWWLASWVLVLGALATVSRTSVIMLLVLVIVFVCLRPKEMKRLWPALLPLLVVVHVALPGTLGTLKSSFFPAGGLIAEQQQSVGSQGQGRIADLGPSLREWREQPLFGQGYGTRTVEDVKQNVQILDDQWLGTLLETGLVGVVGWLWLFWRSIGRFARGAKERSPRGWLLTSLTASVASFAVGMFLFDAFAFIQVTFFLFVLLAFGCVLVGHEEAGERRRKRAVA
jgi:O-antigen ligase